MATVESSTLAGALRPVGALRYSDRAITRSWGWFVGVGAVEVILGGVAATNLLAASVASVLAVGCIMVLAGIVQIAKAFFTRVLRGFLMWLTSGVAYAAAGAIVLCNPIMGSVILSLSAGILLTVAGLMRAWAGLHVRPATGWLWIVSAGVLTSCVGLAVIGAWPSISLWFLGAVLVADLTFQGWGLVAFGVALKVHRSRRKNRLSAA